MEGINTFTTMGKLTLSQIDLNVEEVSLADVKGGQTEEKIYSGTGRDGRTGEMVNEYITIVDDETWWHDYVPVP